VFQYKVRWDANTVVAHQKNRLTCGNCSPPVVVSQGARPIRLRVLRVARQERLADIDARLQ
jgi:hypothetical protein